uniref:Lunapark zinc ribbon domain-containing protein n=1 Tax=Davidia involucrata TaxID=16924 RepID=A0A5B7CDU4_DAVIN
MAGEFIKDQGVGESLDVPAIQRKDDGPTMKRKKRGLMSRIWNGLFRIHSGDFEKRLQRISKEEAAVLARMKKRSQNWRRMARHLIVFSVIFEVIAVGSAIMTTKSLDINWKVRAFRVLPMFLLPCLASITYSALVSFIMMCDRKDQKTLERLRAERQAKIDELKEKTNYYTTQQLIQRYDPDPAAKAAATTVLASKLGADSGLKVYVGDESKLPAPSGKSNDVEFMQTSGLRNRKHMNTRSSSTGSTLLHHSDEEMLHHAGTEGPDTAKHNQLVVDHHHHPGSTTHDRGWIAQIAALLVGEDPTQSYALICGNCHVHNGLARKEEFPYITYYCPHCNALNRSKQLEERVSGSDSPNLSSSTVVSDVKTINNDSGSDNDRMAASSSLVAAAVGTMEGSERIVSGDPVS